MNADNQTDTIINTYCRGYETREGHFGIWGIFKSGQLVSTRSNKEDALQWIEKQADANEGVSR
jgi:hypothetical protein